MTGVFNYLDCSTAHVTEDAMEELVSMHGNAYAPLLVADFGTVQGYGWWIYGDYDDDANVNPCLSAVIKLALQQGCQWVRLSADGTVFNQLKQYQ